MEWNEKLQIIIDYVENHLQRQQEPIDPREIAEIAGCSFGFFQKVFSYLNGVSFSDYIRARKLTLAGYDLKSTDKRVVDVSYQYGYDSSTSFTKAFQQFHGVTPKDARSQGVRLRAVPKMQSSVKQQYMWRLEQKAPFRLIGKSIRISRRNGNHYAKIPAFWSECQRDGIFSHLTSMDEGHPKGLFGLFYCDEKRLNELEYSIMVISDKELPEGYTEIRVPAMTWAVFPCTLETIGKTEAMALSKWLPKSNYRPLNKGYLTGRMKSGAPDVEHYGKGGLVEVWIAVKEK